MQIDLAARGPEFRTFWTERRLATLTTVRPDGTPHVVAVGVTVDFETGLEAVRRLAPLVPEGVSMAQWALRWVLDQPGVSVVIPGARNAEQARANAAAAALPPLSGDDLAAVRAVYDELIRPSVHARW